MPTWIYIALWILWSLWFLVEVLAADGVHKMNNRRARLGYPPVHYTQASLTATIVFIAISVFWLAYNVHRWLQ